MTEPKVRVTKRSALEAGGCNACSSRSQVYEIELGSSVVRVCDDCSRELIAGINATKSSKR